MDNSLSEEFKKEVDGRRFRDVNEARSLFDKWEEDNRLRAATFVQVRNQMEGGRPKDPQVLKRNGTEWETNVNFGDAQAARDRVLLPLWKAVHSAPHAISVTIDSNAPDSARWQSAFEEAFDSSIEDWGQDYTIQFMRAMKNLVDFGGAPIIWREEDCPKWTAVNFQRLYFPKNTRMSMDTWEAVGLVDEVSAGELWENIRNPNVAESAKTVGWNEQAIKRAIVNSSGETQWDGRDFTKWQDLLVNNDIVLSSKFQPIETRIIYVRQFDGDKDKKGKVAKYVFSRNSVTGDDFLFKKEDYADSFQDIFGCVWYDTGTDAMVHSIKGFGIKNYHFSVLQNRVKGKIIDAAGFAMALNFTRGTDMPEEAPPVENYGAVNLFPPGLQQLQYYPQFSQGMQVVEMLEQNQSGNNALYRQQQQQIAESDTATQANILAMQQGEVTEATMALFLAQVGESYFTPMFKRLRRKGSTDEYAKAFQRRCREKGIPEEVIFTTEVRVKAGTSAGMANPVVRAQKFQRGLSLINMPGVNARWFLENVISAEYGSQAVNKALLPPGVDSNPQQRRQAMMENALFGQSMPLPVDPSDAHPEHIDEHLKPIEPLIMQYQNTGQIDQAAIPALVMTVEHVGQHLTYLQRDETKRDIFAQLKQRFMTVQNITKGIVAKLQSENQPQ